MSLIDQIEKIREKSDGTKNMICCWGGVLGTAIVILVWLTVFPSNKNGEKNVSEIEEISKGVAGPFASAKEIFKTTYNDVKDMTALMLEGKE